MQLCSAYMAVNLILARQEEFPWSFTTSISAVTTTTPVVIIRITITRMHTTSGKTSVLPLVGGRCSYYLCFIERGNEV